MAEENEEDEEYEPLTNGGRKLTGEKSRVTLRTKGATLRTRGATLRTNGASFSASPTPDPNAVPRNGAKWVHVPPLIEVKNVPIDTDQTPLPFQITATPDLLSAAPGVVGYDEITDPLMLEEASPADGTWFFVAKVVIDTGIGDIDTSETFWVSGSVPANTATDFHKPLGYVTKVAGEIVDAVQYTYGPIVVVVGGGATDVWIANMS